MKMMFMMLPTILTLLLQMRPRSISIWLGKKHVMQKALDLWVCAHLEMKNNAILAENRGA